MPLPRPPPAGGFSFTWQASVNGLHITEKDFLSTRPLIAAAATGALVFSKASGEDRALIIQRAAHDSMPLLWETPGGACDLEDETILHGVARELWEETGLRMKSVTRQVGGGYTFITRSGLAVTKLTFEAEVETPVSAQGEQLFPKVTLDPNEHVRFLWATEEECRQGRVAALDSNGEPEVVNVEFTTEAQKRIILYGFKLRREAAEGACEQAQPQP
ncbi:MutT-like protein [Madurella mycetomatis]|uniref:MutT-like protein n=1 Tax=Madurella mycetomatis TaxID=100816 RepID=A0A175WFU6_9PEZI|nr:MutT-like protein [Madurella mycetomatis]